MSEASGLLVVRNDRLGDTILALPTVQYLIDKHPSEKISFWSSPALAPLISCVKGLDQVFAASDTGSIKLIPTLRQASLKTAVCLRPTLANAWTLYQAHIPERIGTARRWYSALFNRRVNLRRRGVALHEADLNLQLSGCETSKTPAAFPVFNLPERANHAVDELLSKNHLGPHQPFVVIHPGSGGSARNWPWQHFKMLADRLTAEFHQPVIITGGAAEKELTARVADHRHVDLGGMVSLIELACLLRRASLVVSNSTGPLHLAAALGVRVVGLYPPVADCTPDRWGPVGQPEGAISPDLPLCKTCQPGEISSCRCMESLEPEVVLVRCQKIFGIGQ